MRFCAVGQEAEGFIAIGQMATGVIAIGQVARGVVAIGMMAFGVVSLGMLSGGLVYAVGMVGAGGRGLGFVLPLVPVPRRRPKLPELVPLDTIRASGREGWIRAKLRVGGAGLPELIHEDVALPVTLARSPAVRSMAHSRLGAEVIARVVPKGDALRVDVMKVIARVRGGWLWRAAHISGLVALTLAYWRYVLVDVGDMMVGTVHALLTSQLGW